MTLESIIELANSHGIVKNHFLRLRDLKSGNVVAGVFTKYKQNKPTNLRIRNEHFEVQVIENGIVQYEVLNSEYVEPKKILKNTVPVDKDLIAEILRYCEDNQIYDKLGNYKDFYYKLNQK